MKDAGTGTIPPTSQTSGETTSNEPVATAAPDKPTIPDTYTFTPPEGQSFDKTILDAATPVFKELGLSQAQADKLVTLWNTQAKSQADLHVQAVLAQREKWQIEAKSDPDIGPKLDKIKVDISRAFDIMGDPKLRQGFLDAMDHTGVGDNPAFIKSLAWFASRIVEGKPVNGGGPSPNGQTPTGTVPRPSAASAMYPHLPQQ